MNPELDPATHLKVAEVFRRDWSELQRFVGGRMDELVPGIRAKYPVLCLSDAGSVPLMWSHYAKSHRGICLIFDARSPIIDGAIQVQYSHDYPVITFPDETETGILVKSLLTKPMDWKYEGEYRVIAREHHAGDDNKWTPSSDKGFVDVSPTALVGLILGAFMSPDEEAWARGLVASATTPIQLWRAHLEPRRYALRIEREA